MKTAENMPLATGAARVPWLAVVTFVALACGTAWLVTLPLWLEGGLASPWAAALLPLMMMTPAVATVIVLFVFRVPGHERAAFLGLWPLRPVGRLLLFLALGLFLPMIVVIAAALVAGALGLVRLDLISFSGFADQLAAAAPGAAPALPIQVLVIVQMVALPIGAIINSVFALGEELGWRGWLHSALLPLGVWPTLLITGVIWGLWHAPLILLGYNFGRPDLGGLAFMVGGCVAWGVLLGWLRLRSASLWPAVLAHGSLNAVGGVVLVFIASGEVADMAIVGPLGVVVWVMLAVCVAVIALVGQFRRGAPATVARVDTGAAR
ncbi:CPBP family intramembrane glutamic endopeptidase [Microbacterium sp. C7(2022)]|uniref:CPBP family intramembrane glutamic endopeptidase n=1 Tax=Microbacterium sp. C7(2022) TaxID=2992759 RepID=UPI00237B111B|nr:CPBP family intramembrane glutamic endopeptidase [Microbacterium sp. C7(2022)]MDE0545790.1 CPBP family intramembrane metalloprotease [Microbacterium sp. C7(2022)]